jgi:hypothetical protein
MRTLELMPGFEIIVVKSGTHFSHFSRRRQQMNTRLATKQIRLQQWAAIIKDRTESGLKVDDYCGQHQLSRDAYYYWLHKVKETALESNGSKFVELKESAVPVVVPQISTINTPHLTLEINGVIIRVDNTASRELLTMAVEVALHVK